MWLAPKKSLQSLSAIPGDCIHAIEILFARAMSHVRESAKRLLREAENFLHEKIPITRAMGIRVISSGNEFAIEAPVALNFNHLGTGFGGSINAVATLAGYVFLWIELHEIPGCHVVVRESSIRFLRPVRKTIRAICVRPAQQETDRFKSKLVEKGRARLRLTVRIEEDSKIAAEFEGTFVALDVNRGHD